MLEKTINKNAVALLIARFCVLVTVTMKNVFRMVAYVVS